MRSGSLNLGNALDAPVEGDWGVVLKKKDFELISAAGFDSVRVPIRWSAHSSTKPPYNIDPAFLKRVDWAVSQALAKDMAVVINIHHYEELMKRPLDEKARFLALWRQIAEHYSAAPDCLLFEILNEPVDKLTPDLWNQFLSEALQVIRQSNPRRTVVIGTTHWGSIDGLKELILPEEEKNAIVTFHYYQPFHFTHQGASWITESDRWQGTRWEGTPQEKQAVIRDLDKSAEWSEASGCPLYMGEFGAYKIADMQSRTRWTRFVAREAEKRNITWGYWEFCSGFGVYNPSSDNWRSALLEALLP